MGGTVINGIHHDNWCDKGTTMCSPWSTKTRWDIKYEGDSLIIYQGRPEILCFRSTILDRRLGDVLSEAINESVDALLNLFCDLSLGDILDTRIGVILYFIGRQSIGPLLPILDAQATVGSLASQLYDGFRALPCAAAETPLIGDLLDDVIFANIPVDGGLDEILGQVIDNIAPLQLTDTQTVEEFVESALDFVGNVLVELLSILDPPNEGEPQCGSLITEPPSGTNDGNIGAAIICPVVNIAANLWDLIVDNQVNILDALVATTDAIPYAISFIIDVLDRDGLLDDAAGYLAGLFETDGTPCVLPVSLAVPIYNLLTTDIPDYGLIGQVFCGRGLLPPLWTTPCDSSVSCDGTACCSSNSDFRPNCNRA